MGSKSSVEHQKFRHSDHQSPQNDVGNQNPQSGELGLVKPQSFGAETTAFNATDPSSSVIDADLKPNQPKMLQQNSVPINQGFGVGNQFDYQIGSVEDGIFRKTLDEDIYQVFFKEALNEAVMNLALGEDINVPGDEKSRHFDSNRGGEVGQHGTKDEVEVGLGRGMNGGGWEESDGKRARSESVNEFQGQNGNDEFGSQYGKDEEEENYGTEETSGYGGSRNYNTRSFQYPMRLEAEDCSYYIKTGNCKFGMNCKYNHPPKKRNQGARDKAKPRAEDTERLGQTECKYYLTSGGCKFGSACKYNHSRERSAVAPIVEFNFLGLPIRMGEKECPYYMRTGSCKYGSNCRFNHPDPTSVAGHDPTSGYGNGGSVQLHGAAQSTAPSWSSAPMMFPPTQGIPSSPKWTGYQATVYPTSERSLPTPPAFSMNIPATETNFYVPHQQQMPVDEFPQRPGQPDCSYFLKTGDCKYKANCRFHHPKFQSSKSTSCALSDKGLPLRPDQSICSFYNRYGICKFGPACKFDHPENWGKSVSSDGVRMARNEMEAGFS
ncbi:hypothetical protein ACH5RR_025336 [Cinchona calisaya]|uniref:C3H1-type domain-containing protein n=1 Tax=Cinchona calisaya TaxID=153742 RepID=A0ABD2Z1U0_9GENT